MDDSNKSCRYDNPTRGKCEAMSIRVVVEFILACYFGGEIKDDLFEIFSKNIEEYLGVEDGKYTNMIISRKNVILSKLGIRSYIIFQVV